MGPEQGSETNSFDAWCNYRDGDADDDDDDADDVLTISARRAGHRSASASGFLISLCRVHHHTSPAFIAYLQYDFLISSSCVKSAKHECA